jgi:hypothetical protein
MTTCAVFLKDRMKFTGATKPRQEIRGERSGGMTKCRGASYLQIRESDRKISQTDFFRSL